MTFRFAAKYGLLTYAQIGDRDVEEFGWRVSDMFGSLGAECIVGRESHGDGGLHIHAFFMFERKFQSRNVRVFDMDGCHPNIVRGYSTPEDGARYAIKEGDVIAGGLDVDSLGSSVAGSKTVWAQIILAESRDDFFAACAELAPRALLCSFTSLRCYADWKYREDPAPYRHPEDVSFDTSRFPELDRWVQDSLRGAQRGKRCSLRSGSDVDSGFLPIHGSVPLGPIRLRRSDHSRILRNANL
ncbi:RepA [Sewage associated gemycircularvirus 3]|uniref:RepA n=1 Tax=Sewage associated gemycircularvirus 3 TaxID=1843761 RepID=A0A168MGB9_9VIRU|nr:RepA [Sewage associated gemycircularvirus 3]